jgi:hypothetical protein
MSDDNQSVASATVAPAMQSATSLAVPSATASTQPVAQSAPPAEPEVTLDQFGIELSHRDKRVELLNAFVFAERQAKHFKDTKTNYLTRFDAFADQPA